MKPLRLVLPLLLALAAISAAPTHAPKMTEAASSSYQPSFPINAAFFYAVQVPAKSRVHPTAKVDYGDSEVIRNQIEDMLYAGQAAGIYSWFGIGSYPDQQFSYHLRAADDTPFRWALLDENEGGGKNPSVTAIRADLNHIYSLYGTDPNYLKVGGKPVLFTYGDANDTCNAAARWRAADNANRFYLVMKTVSGYTHCNPQPQGWYGYAPANGSYADGNAFDVSPGFDAYDESSARLPRSVARFASDLRAMKASKARFHLTTTWNEWSQATGVERASEWASSSGHGKYVDQMHSILGQSPGVPASPGALNAGTSGEDVSLGWTNVSGATSYQVFRNGCLVATVSTNSWTDTSLTDESASYAIKSVGARGTSRRGPVVIGHAGSPSAAPTSSGDGMVAVQGQRILSTANGAGAGCAGRQRSAQVVSVPSTVPARATGVVLSLTSLNSLGNGTVSVYPAGTSEPPVSQLRYYSTRASSNTVVVPLGTARQIVFQQSGAATHLYADLIGYTIPGADGLQLRASNDPVSQVFLDTRNNTGGVGSSKVKGTVTAPLPSWVPDGVSAVEVRLLITGAAGAGSATVFEGGAKVPAITSLGYASSVSLTTSTLVPVNSNRMVSVNVNSTTNVIAGIEGWVTNGGRDVTVTTPTRLLAETGRVTSARVHFPDADDGRTALLNVGTSAALGYGNASLTSDGGEAPQIQTVSYGPQQPQSGFLWIRIPANGYVDVTLSKGALLYVDQLALA